MIDFYNFLYSKIKNENTILNKFKFNSFLRFIVRFAANITLPAYFYATSNNKNNKIDISSNKINDQIIISLTSFPARINKTWLTVETLLRQKQKPTKIILWLSKEQFSDLNELPSNLLKLCKRGLDIEIRDNDLRSHKKYYYAKKEYPNATIILADDDILYPSNMVQELCSTASKFPGKVICRFAKKILWDSDNTLRPYLSWKNINEGIPSNDIFFGSGGGTLIPASSIHPGAINKEAFLINCPHADDIWLNAMCRLNSTEFVSTRSAFSMLPIIYLNNIRLSTTNNDLGQNDRQLAKVISYCLTTYNVNPFGKSCHD